MAGVGSLFSSSQQGSGLFAGVAEAVLVPAPQTRHRKGYSCLSFGEGMGRCVSK